MNEALSNLADDTAPIKFTVNIIRNTLIKSKN